LSERTILKGLIDFTEFEKCQDLKYKDSTEKINWGFNLKSLVLGNAACRVRRVFQEVIYQAYGLGI